jgi:hypothetical protein
MTANPIPETRHTTMLRRVKVMSTGGSPWTAQRLLLTAGSVAIPAGIALMLLGWLGAARSVIVFNQLSYIASGSVIGLALTVLGGFLYLAYLVTVLIEEGREREARQATQQRELLDRFDQLTAALVGRPAVAAPSGSAFVMTENGSMVHKTSCAIVRDREGLVGVSENEASRLKACRICKPLG